jgi:G3E family GTPase
VLALAGGCVCCGFGADLVGTLMKVARRDPRPDIVLIECSGVGLPGAVALSAALAPGVRVDGIAVVVDAAELMRLARDAYVGDTVHQQLQHADLLIVNQADRVAAAALAQATQWLAEAAPGVPQLDCTHARVPADLVLGLARHDEAADAARADAAAAAWTATARRGASAQRGADRFRFFCRDFDQPVDVHALAAGLASAPSCPLRTKGVLRGLDGQAWLVQGMGRRFSIEPAPAGAAVGTLACIAVAPSTAAA